MKTKDKLCKKENNKISKCRLFVIINIIILIIVFCLPSSESNVKFRIKYSRDISSTSVIYYDMGTGFSEDNTAISEIKDGVADICLDIETVKKIEKYRLDPVGLSEKDFSIDSLELFYNDIKIKQFDSQTLVTYLSSCANATVDSDFVLSDIENDCYMCFSSEFTQYINKSIKESKFFVILRLKIYRTMLFAIICIVLYCVLLFLLKHDFISKTKKFVMNHKIEKVGFIQYLLLVFSVIFFVLATIIFTLKQFLLDNFSGLTFSEVLFHLKVPMEGTSNDMIFQFFNDWTITLVVVLLILIVFVFIIFFFKKISHNKLTYITSFCSSLVIIAIITSISLNELGIMTYIES